MTTLTLPTTTWKIADVSRDVQDRLARELGIHPIISRILTSRNILNADEARRYLSPSLNDLHSPFLLKDMRRAVDRTLQAVYRREKITVFGDYDADGITSVVVLIKFLKQFDPTVQYYIPDRIDEGYGLNREAIDRIRQGGSRLIITIDCGVSDRDPVASA